MLRISIIIFYCLVHFSYSREEITRTRPRNGDLRLIGGNSINEGNVEILHNGRWGAICDDSWDTSEAQVVCRQLGFENAFSTVATISGHFGKAKRAFWMSDILCNGTENKISDCRFDGWAQNDCSPNEAAGVICDSEHFPKKNIKLDLRKKYPKLKVKQGMQVRIKGGRISTEGRVEVSFDGKRWGTLCADGWSILEANVVCKQLRLGYASDALQTDAFGGQSVSSLLMTGTMCQGNETKLSECIHLEIGKVSCPGDRNYVAAVMCTRELPDLVFDIEELEQSLHMEDRMLYFLQCAMEENCLSSLAYEIQRTNEDWAMEHRRLLKFTAKTLNAGNVDFRPHIPKYLWQWHACHMHFHSMEVFANFDVYDLSGKKVAEGHKASFCLEDNQCKDGTKPKYNCSNYGDQGISVNCYDIYRYNIDCQWIDITDIDFGHYTLKISINPDFKVPEMDYHNNGARCSLVYMPTNAKVYGCKLERP